jgi:DNA-binding MurR/RpiR family transcriptional regulator
MVGKKKQKAAGARAGMPGSYEGIVDLITKEYPGLSPGYQQIARFFTQNPNVIALESINAIAEKSGVHPSSLVRFSQSLGYSGFKELQAVFQTRLATAAPGFRERIGALDSELSRNVSGNMGLLKDIVVRDIASLQGMFEGMTETLLSEAGHLIAEAETIYIAGQLRSEPIAILLRYLLTMLQRRVVLLDPAGGLAQEMALTMGTHDVLVAIAFRHYAKEVVTIAELAANAGVPILSITDSQLSPIAKDARVVFSIPEEEYTFSRSLATPICLAQCLATVTASILRPTKGEAPRIPSVTEIAKNKDARLPPQLIQTRKAKRR